MTFCLLFVGSLRADEAPSLSKELMTQLAASKEEIKKQYLAIHSEFSSKVCRGGVEENFWKLNREYRGFGFYVPTTFNDELDRDTVNRFLPELKAKLKWINEQIQFLEKLSNDELRKSQELTRELEGKFSGLLEMKKDIYMGDSAIERERARIKSRYALIQFRGQWRSLLSRIPFLLSYKHPVDHFDLRKSNDRLRAIRTDQARKEANEVYFYRKIVQDGAQNPDRSRGDAFLRSVIDTITNDLSGRADYLSENLRYDLEFALSGIQRQLRPGKPYLLPRLNEWKERTEAAVEFYTSLQDNSKELDDEHKTGEDVASTLAKAREALKDFSLTKQAETYEFWKGQPELMRALFSIETILYNEVADLDGERALERRDITQVVINRTHTERYSHIPAKEPFASYLSKEVDKLKKYVWLNALFKRAEFSFTLYFINSNIRVFCPEMTRRGRALRDQNLSVALDRLNNPNYDFDALRYFSRHSMQGRIDMSEIWSDYKEFPEREGPILNDDSELVSAFNASRFEFHYRFTNYKGEEFDVLKIGNSQYARNRKNGTFHVYRNPHYFRYYRHR